MRCPRAGRQVEALPAAGNEQVIAQLDVNSSLTSESEALMILVRGEQIEGGVYSCSAYEQYHLKSQKCSSKRWIRKHERISRPNFSTAAHTSYPNLQVSNPIVAQEGALFKRHPSDWDLTLEEGVST